MKRDGKTEFPVPHRGVSQGSVKTENMVDSRTRVLKVLARE